MAGTKIIKQKIKAITSIKKITKTMEMVSFAKMKKSNEEMSKISNYIKETKKLVISAKTELKDEYILFSNKNSNSNLEQKSLVLIFASNKGLCGSFNSNIYKKTKKLIEENPEIKHAICFGKFADKIAKRLNLQIELSFYDIEKTNSYTKILKIEKEIRSKFLESTYKTIFASYTNFVKNGVYENRTVNIYPVNENLNVYEDIANSDSEADENNPKSKQILTFEPGVETLLSALIPKLITVILYSFILESRASEYSMRSFAMKRANESAGDLLRTLKIKYNRVRQDSITQEIAEISAGANA